MTALEALEAARAAGVEVVVDGSDLLLRAPGPPPTAVLEALSKSKAEIVALLRGVVASEVSARADWTAGDWRARFDELAGSREYENGLERADAEDGAYLELLGEWLRANSDIRRPNDAPAVFVAMGALRRIGIVPSAERMRLARSDEDMRSRFRAAREAAGGAQDIRAQLGV